MPVGSRRVTGALLAGAALAGTFLAAQPARGAWTPASNLSRGPITTSSPSVAIGPGGLTTVAWTRNTGSRILLEASTRAAGQSTFGAPVDLSPLAGGDLSTPNVAIGPDGTTTVVSVLNDSGTPVLNVSSRPAGQAAFSDLVGPSAAGGDVYTGPAVAIGPSGTTALAWGFQGLGGFPLAAATRVKGASQYSSPPQEFPSAGGNTPAIAAGSDGTFTIAAGVSGTPDVVRAITRPPGAPSTFSSDVPLSSGTTNALFPALATGPQGTTAVAWQQSDGAKDRVMFAARGPWPSAFGAAQPLSPAGSNAIVPDVAVGPGGMVAATWTRFDGSNWIVQARVRPAGSSSFSAPVNLSRGATAGVPRVAVGPDGAIAVIWSQLVGSDDVVYAATRDAGSGSFSAPVALSRPGSTAFDQQLAAPPAGSDPCRTSFTAVWGSTSGAIQQSSRPVSACAKPGKARLGTPAVTGPRSVRRRKKASFRVTVRNGGTAAATGVTLKVVRSGRTLASRRLGRIEKAKSKTVQVPLAFSRRGRPRLTFTAASANAGRRSVTRSIRVR